MSSVEEIRSSLSSLRSPKKAAALTKHFKAGPGQYACGDVFLGIDMANQRNIAKEHFSSLSLEELQELIKESVHEYRMTTLMIISYKFSQAKTEEERKEIVDFYLDNLDFVNNWDLVDTTAERILGAYLMDKDRDLLIEMAGSRRLWRERLSLLASIHFVKNNDFSTSFEIIKVLATHPHEIIHQAVGKVIGEIVKKDSDAADDFLSRVYKRMPSNMLRQAIAGLNESRQQAFKTGAVQPAEEN